MASLEDTDKLKEASLIFEKMATDSTGDGGDQYTGLDRFSRYQGGRLDPTTGLYNFQHRDYSPNEGRWIEQDPAMYVNGLDTYQIELSDPVGLIDQDKGSGRVSE
jgi:RHS repeat-associated protein